MDSSTENKSRISPHLIYGIIIAALLGGGGYLWFNKSKTEDKLQESQTENVSLMDDKQMLETDYNAALARLDEMKTQSVQMDSLLVARNDEVEELKNKIQGIIADKNASADQLKEARAMIKSLNDKLSSFEKQITALKQENIQLSEDKKELIQKTEEQTTENNTLKGEKAVLAEEKATLEKTVEKGSVLHASSIRMESINEKKNLLGKEKEVETGKAKKADLIRLTFNIDGNRISEDGEKLLYICVYEPNGSVAGNGSKFKLADGGGDKSYTTTRTVPFKTGQAVKNVSTDWRPINGFAKGNYKVEIYHMGYKIGSEQVSLK